MQLIKSKFGDYEFGSVKIIKNMNRIGGKFFYVIFINEVWAGRIFFDRKVQDWLIGFEEGFLILPGSEEGKFIFEVFEEIKKNG